MRYLISRDFLKVQPGSYTALSFWVTATLFVTEHCREVGLNTGIAYSYWMIRTRSLGDSILAHGVTNACLAAYVMLAGRCQYWP